MALLSASNVTKAFGVEEIFHGVSFEVQDNDRIGLVGRNGSGKTTLFKLLTGEMQTDSGSIFRSKNAVIGYMEQHVCRDMDVSAYSEVLHIFDSLINIEHELEYTNEQLQSHSQLSESDLHQLIEKQAHLNDSFVQNGGLTFRGRVRSTLLGLGFDDVQMGLPVMSLSGGQKAKLQLAKMLLSNANLLLLDEPTNHLDIPSVEWLEDFLRSYPGAFLVISHDRYFLDKITNRTFEIEHKKLHLYKGNYTTFLHLKEEENKSLQRKYDNTKKEIDRIYGIVEQQRQWNRERNIKTAESKLKMIDRLENTLEKPGEEPERIHFDFSIRNRGGNDVLSAENLSLYFDHARLFENVNLDIHRGERVFLIGPNGCGKTSLFKTLLGENEPTGGEIQFGAGIDIGYYDQIQENLDPSKTVLDEIWDSYPRMTQTEIRNALAVFLFKGEDVFKSVSTLSGGERARVLLLRLMLSQANFLLLDEPTNHLDITSCEALEHALRDYEGTLLLISHDRYLINKIADKIYVLSENGTTEYRGNYDDYLQKRKEEQDDDREENCKPPVPKVNEYKLRKEAEAERRKLRSALKRAEDDIEQVEQEMAILEEKLQDPSNASDYAAALELTQQLDALREQNEVLMETWEELSQKVEETQADT